MSARAHGARARGRTNDGRGGRRARDAGRRDGGVERGVVAFRRDAHDRASKSDRPPWTTSYAFDANALALNGACEGGARETREATPEATLEVASRGANGFLVDVSVTGSVAMRCARCDETFLHDVMNGRSGRTNDSASTPCVAKAWLDPDADEDAFSGEYEIYPFPVTVDAVDLTPLVADTVRAFGVPEEFVCETCAADEPRVWRA